ncbi:hypothetical protein QQF64_018992 [Cirrhinus molitorella]|uniref:Ig-like domain-containing protein n=1 Tax=Cirrhinus molitorella TaxID=172907 RepID=A0ABR3LE78_9TELE
MNETSDLKQLFNTRERERLWRISAHVYNDGGQAADTSSVFVNLHKVKIMNSRLSSLILLLLIPGTATFDQLSVTCSQQSICAVKGTEVKLECFYSNINFKTVFWFSEKQSTNWRKNNEPEDLTLDSDYSGRVKHQISYSSSILTISDVRKRDSGEYQLMFIMNDGVKHRSSAAVSLTVTDLHVRMNPASTDSKDETVKLTCDTSCDLTFGVYYYWMKDGQYFTHTVFPSMIVSISTYAGSFSCSHEDRKHPSSSVCLSKSGCWDVTYSSRRVCALVGSTVDISCIYSHPSGHTVNKTFWHYGPSDGQSGDFKDLREDDQFAGRVEYVGNKLRIKELKISDSGEYRFRIITDLHQYSGSPGVILTVTDTQVTSSPDAASEGKKVILSCLTKCTLNNKHTYIWYKNRRQVTDGFTKANKLYLDSVSNEELEQYSCAVGDPVDITAFSHYTVTLLVFLPQFLIIAALWMSSSSVFFIVCVDLHKVKIMNSRLSPLILLLLIPGPAKLDQLSVTCRQQSICAMKRKMVTLRCFPYNTNFKTAFWFSEKQSANWRKNNEPEDLTLDSDYSGRVKQTVTKSHSTLTISDVRERDSGEYQLMFIMNDGVKHRSSAAVNLTVTDLQVRMNPASTDPTNDRVTLTCDTSCDLTSGVYHWKKNGKLFTQTWSPNLSVSISRDTGSFSCYREDNKHSSSSVCLSKSGCWGVTYTSRRVCALVGSTVDISCTYSHPSGHTVNKTFWHYSPSDGQSGDFKDLREDNQFAGRVEYVGNKLRIKELKISDSGEYRFRFITDTIDGKYSGSPGVILTVTDTQVKSSPDAVLGREKVILSCLTKCTLNNKHAYIWYKNGHQITDGFTKANKLYLDSFSDKELQQYSCAVEDREESTALRNTAVILCVVLTLAVIGILWYRRRRCTLSLSKTQRTEKGEEEVQNDLVHNNTATSDHTQKADADNQDIHYSSISFKTKHAIPTNEYPTNTTETEAVYYATVSFK